MYIDPIHCWNICEIHESIKHKGDGTGSPEDALVPAVHGSDRALKVLGKVLRIGQRAQHSIAARAVRVVFNLLLQALRVLIGTPICRIRDEEQLLGCESLQAGKTRLGSVDGDVVLVGAESLADPAVVGNVLALRNDPVDLFHSNRHEQSIPLMLPLGKIRPIYWQQALLIKCTK